MSKPSLTERQFSIVWWICFVAIMAIGSLSPVLNHWVAVSMCLVFLAIMLSSEFLIDEPDDQPASDPFATLLAEARSLIATDNRDAPATGRHLPEGLTIASYRLISGVWIEAGLYYAALGVPLGVKPDRPDTRDWSPGIPESEFGGCQRCGISWKWVEGHTTKLPDGSGVFPLCELCWSSLTPQDRVPYYLRLWDSNRLQMEEAVKAERSPQEIRLRYLEKWAVIEAAVLAEGSNVGQEEPHE